MNQQDTPQNRRAYQRAYYHQHKTDPEFLSRRKAQSQKAYQAKRWMAQAGVWSEVLDATHSCLTPEQQADLLPTLVSQYRLFRR